jgi:hypothetical protein
MTNFKIRMIATKESINDILDLKNSLATKEN